MLDTHGVKEPCDQMSPIPILRSIARLNPGDMLDIGARDCMMAGFFAELGYKVDAVDPEPAPDPLPDGVAYHQTTLEDFADDKRYDLVAASFVSQFVRYDVRTLLERLKTLMKPDGLVYVTLIGDEDGWADMPWSKAMSFDEACATITQCGLKPVHRSVEWFDGRLYSGEPKFWHVYKFALGSD